MNGWKKYIAIIGAIATMASLLATMRTFADHEIKQQDRIAKVEAQSENTKNVVEKVGNKLEQIRRGQNEQSRSLAAIQAIMKIWAQREGIPYTGN